MDAAARLSALLTIANAFQAGFEGHDLLNQMRDAAPVVDGRSRWVTATHLALLQQVYRAIMVARTRQVAPSEETLNCALLWMAAVWGTVDWSCPRNEERRTGWPASVPHPFTPRPEKPKKEAA